MNGCRADVSRVRAGWRALCRCGWVGWAYWPTERAAWTDAEDHVLAALDR